jgi:Mce-associated membrane protein
LDLVTEGGIVSASENRTLKLVQGGAAGTQSPARSIRRRAATRRTPRQRDPITAVLEHLDEEPALPDVPPEIPDEPDEPEPARKPALSRTARARAHRRAVHRPEPPVRPWRRLPRPALSTVLLAVVLCLALAGAGVFGTRWYHDRMLDRAHQQALAAAKQTTVNFVSVSASSVDRDLQRIVDGATGDFQDEFTRGRAQVRAAIVENNVESRGTVLRAALISGDRHTAVVLVAVDATVRNTKSPDGRASHYRIQVDVTHDAGSGRWLVSRLQFVG